MRSFAQLFILVLTLIVTVVPAIAEQVSKDTVYNSGRIMTLDGYSTRYKSLSILERTVRYTDAKSNQPAVMKMESISLIYANAGGNGAKTGLISLGLGTLGGLIGVAGSEIDSDKGFLIVAGTGVLSGLLGALIGSMIGNEEIVYNRKEALR